MKDRVATAEPSGQPTQVDLPTDPRAGEGEDDLERARVLGAVRAGLLGEDDPPPQIGRFEVRRRLGLGAMGLVFEAYDASLDRGVAIKLLRGDERLGNSA